MPCIWGDYSNSQIFLNVALLPLDVAEAMRNGSLEEPTNVDIFKALCDTGAQSTCVSKKAAETIGLKPIGKVPVSGVSGVSFHNNYLFHVGFVFGHVETEKEVSKTALHILSTPIQGAEFHPGGGNFDILLGMDVIGVGSLNVSGDGHFSFCF